ncbi:glycosyltransferase, partial [Vibrio parahaemolyticus]
MNPLILSHSDSIGGAARAAYRIHSELILNNIESKMMVRVKMLDDDTILGPTNEFDNRVCQMRTKFNSVLNKVLPFRTSYQSFNLLPSNLNGVINSSNYSLVNFHWVGAETINFEDAIKINKPIVWTMHDMWPVLNGSHITSATSYSQWKASSSSISNFLNSKKWSFLEKLDHVVTPSFWLADFISQCPSLSNKPISVIPNVLDMDVFKPKMKLDARKLLGLNSEKVCLLFSANGGTRDFNKGFDILKDALNMVSTTLGRDKFELIIVGQHEPVGFKMPCETKWFGHVSDDDFLATIYAAVDYTIIPSRIENFPQVGTESICSGTPLIGMPTTGVKELIGDSERGLVANRVCATSLAEVIKVAIYERNIFSQEVLRKYALDNWSSDIVYTKYNTVYE